MLNRLLVTQNTNLIKLPYSRIFLYRRLSYIYTLLIILFIILTYGLLVHNPYRGGGSSRSVNTFPLLCRSSFLGICSWGERKVVTAGIYAKFCSQTLPRFCLLSNQAYITYAWVRHMDDTYLFLVYFPFIRLFWYNQYGYQPITYQYLKTDDNILYYGDKR